MALTDGWERASSRWIRWVLGRPWWVVAAVLVTTVAAMAGLPRLELRMDGRAMVPPDDPTVIFDRDVRQVFGRRDPLVVLVEGRGPGGVYDPEVLRRVAEISRLAAGLDRVGPEHVMSLATERRDRVYPNTLRFRPFLDPFPDTPTLLRVLADDVEATRILEGTLVSRDASGAAVLVGVPDVEEVGDRAAFYRRVRELVQPFESPEVRITVVGAPAAEALLGYHILDDLERLLPLTLATIALLLLLRLGRLWAVLVTLSEVGLCLAATFGLMGWLGVPLSLTTGVLPVVLVSLGLADEIHIFSHYQRVLDAAPAGPGDGAIETTFREMIPPVLLTSATTALGFLSFLASPIRPIRHFGLFAAVGILYCLIFSLTVMPASLKLLPAAALRSPRRRRDRSDLLLGLVRPLLRRPAVTLVALALAVAFVASGIRDLTVQDSWIDGFAPGSKFRRDTDHVNDELLGTHSLLVHLQAFGDGSGRPPEGDGRSGWLLDPKLLEEIGRFEAYVRSLDGVGGVLGPYSHLTTVAYLWRGRKEGMRAIPEDPVTVARVYRFFDLVRGKNRRREVVNDGLDRALVNVFLKDANYLQTKVLIDDILGWQRNFHSQRVRLSVAGDVAVSQAMIPAIVHSQVASLLLAVGGAFLVLCLLLRSLRTGLLALLPTAAAVACIFGAMGWLGIPLGVATSMFCAITLGVGVDYAIHYVSAHRRRRAAGAAEPALAALEEAGPPILTDMAVIGCSFAWMATSQVPSNARLGLLVALALASACLLTLAGLGSFWSWREARAAPRLDADTVTS